MLRTAAILAALAAGGGFPEPPPEPGPNARLGARVLGEATVDVEQRWRACRFIAESF